jgi:indole-3-glycerol phosphate synthase
MLDQILSKVRAGLDAVIAEEASYRRTAEGAPPGRGFAQALAAPGLSVIAEIKRRSPSAGDLSPDLNPVRLARIYEQSGAAAISVLTEPDFFGGSLDDLRTVRGEVSLPVLRKDFILHPAQVWQSRVAGADAVLLIVAALSDDDLVLLLSEASEAGLDALVEAHTAEEAQRAVAAGAAIVGVNNRDLTTFITDLATAESIAPLLPGRAVRVAESGVSTVEGARRMAAARYDAVLVGGALVTASDPGHLLGELAAAGVPAL